MTLPEEIGGLGGGPKELVVVLSGLAGACGSTGMIYLMHISAAMTVAAAPPSGLARRAARAGHRTATGVYWHPMSAEHADQLVTRDIFPPPGRHRQVRRRFAEHRADAIAAVQWFPCA